MKEVRSKKENLSSADFDNVKKYSCKTKPTVISGNSRAPLSCKTNNLENNPQSSAKLGEKIKKSASRLRLGFPVCEDKSASKQISRGTCVDAGVQTEPISDEQPKSGDSAVQAAVADLCAEEPSADYWRALAATRQRALEVTLAENEKLHEQVSLLQQENGLLQQVVQRAEDVVASVQEWSQEQQQTHL